MLKSYDNIHSTTVFSPGFGENTGTTYITKIMCIDIAINQCADELSFRIFHSLKADTVFQLYISIIQSKAIMNIA